VKSIARSTWMRLVAALVLGLTLGLMPATAASAAGHAPSVDRTQPRPADVASATKVEGVYYLWIECELNGQEGVEDGLWGRYWCIPSAFPPGPLSFWVLLSDR
jgi:hypothetical protein